MIKLTVLYDHPEDAEAFDAYYLGTHMPLARKVPGLEKDEVTVFGPGPDGTAPPYHLMTELYFADAAAMGAGMGSDEGKAVSADTQNFPPGTKPATIVIGEVV
jgi:uncharacterized protein (TIGR02118 family)